MSRVQLKPLNPYPLLIVILATRGTHFEGFSLKNLPIFQNLALFRKMDSCLAQECNTLGLAGFTPTIAWTLCS